MSRRKVPRKKESDEQVPAFDDITTCEIIGRVLAGANATQAIDALPPGLDINRNHPYPVAKQAWRDQRLQYISPLEDKLKNQLRLRSIAVAVPRDLAHVQGQKRWEGLTDAVCDRTAQRIMDILRDCWSRGREEARIGFSGGETMSKVVDFLKVRMMDARTLPNRIVVYGLTASLQRMNAKSPEAFLPALFKTQKVMADDLKMFESRESHEAVTEANRDQKLESMGLLDAHQEILAGKLDLLVTSAASADDGDSQLRMYLQYLNLEQKFQGDGYIGDMLWQPISEGGPIDLPSDMPRPLSLVDLKDLPALIGKGTRVLLALTPCAKCGMLKTSVAKALIRQKHRYFTDLVVDCESASELARSSLAQPA